MGIIKKKHSWNLSYCIEENQLIEIDVAHKEGMFQMMPTTFLLEYGRLQNIKLWVRRLDKQDVIWIWRNEWAEEEVFL